MRVVVQSLWAASGNIRSGNREKTLLWESDAAVMQIKQINMNFWGCVKLKKKNLVSVLKLFVSE